MSDKEKAKYKQQDRLYRMIGVKAADYNMIRLRKYYDFLSFFLFFKKVKYGIRILDYQTCLKTVS